jgi:hypothetical protein
MAFQIHARILIWGGIDCQPAAAVWGDIFMRSGWSGTFTLHFENEKPSRADGWETLVGELLSPQYRGKNAAQCPRP